MSLVALNNFSKQIGLQESVTWENRSYTNGDGEKSQVVSSVLPDKKTANQIASLMNTALDKVKGPPVDITPSRFSPGFRVLLDPYSYYSGFVEDYLRKFPPPPSSDTKTSDTKPVLEN